MQILQRPYDDITDNTPDFWQKSPTNKAILAQPKKYESLLAVHRKYKTKEWKFRTFRLTDDLLIYFSVQFYPLSTFGSKYHDISAKNCTK